MTLSSILGRAADARAQTDYVASMRLAPILAFFAVLALAACAAAPSDGERFPTPEDYGPGVMQRVDFTAGVPEGWRLSSLRSGPREHIEWRIVVISGTPSWSRYWAPTIAALPDTWEMIVIDRPGFSASEPAEAVPDIEKQAAAMAPMLDAPPGVRVALLGQSFGAPIAAIMAAEHPDKVDALILASSYFGIRGPTANRLFGAGRIVRPLLPHDLKNAVSEIAGQEPQLPRAWAALESLHVPVTFVHGDADTFVPAASAEGFAETYHAQYVPIPGGDHFLNACCVSPLLDAVRGTIDRAGPPQARVQAAALP
ncbi:MAG: alpha/beta hydrolase [Caulobacterales bacterium]